MLCYSSSTVHFFFKWSSHISVEAKNNHVPGSEQITPHCEGDDRTEDDLMRVMRGEKNWAVKAERIMRRTSV